jgi:hypothetical protein
MRICNKCHEEKPLSEYWKHKTGPGGIRSSCKACCKLDKKDWIVGNFHRRWAYDTIRHHIEKGIEVRITLNALEQIAKDNSTCALCNDPLVWAKGSGERGSNGKSPTLDRVNNDSFIDLGNFMIVCHDCNSTKRDRTLEEYKAFIAKMYKIFNGDLKCNL